MLGFQANQLRISCPFSLQQMKYFLRLLNGNALPVLDIEACRESLEQDAEIMKGMKQHYETHIYPLLEEFERTRLRQLEILRFRGTIAAVIALVSAAIICFVYFIIPQNELSGLLQECACFVVMLATIGIVWWTSQPATEYHHSVKSMIFRRIFSYFGHDFNYSPHCPYTIESLEASQIIPYHTRARLEDYIKGSHAGVSIEMLEAQLTRRQGSGKQQHDVTIFQGLCILLGMNKSFSGTTIIMRDATMLGNWLRKKTGSLKKVALEDPVFEKQFEVYANDQIEARYLLTPAFMERLLELCRLLGSNDIQSSFYENRLLLMIPSAINRFEPSSIFLPASFIDDFRMILQEMNMVFSIIDTLKLQENTGL